MNATAIATGGGSAKQMDCGSVTIPSNGTCTVNFNFTFTNVPKVVCTMSEDWQLGLIPGVSVFTITTTSFKVNAYYMNTVGAIGWANGNHLTWIAIG